MLIDIKNKIDEEPIKELFSYSVFPDPENTEIEIAAYKADSNLELLGYEEANDIIGIVGYAMHKDNHIEIKHLAVDPESRGNGYGRGIILELIELKQPAVIHAVTDEDAIDFYRNVGFTVTSLGVKQPGVELFQCSYEVEMDEE
ncbi:MAG: family acetyltransferase [Bacilli bacterium]|nr:family acetyltransferase [Bacilli bacterium]